MEWGTHQPEPPIPAVHRAALFYMLFWIRFCLGESNAEQKFGNNGTGQCFCVLLVLARLLHIKGLAPCRAHASTPRLPTVIMTLYCEVVVMFIPILGNQVTYKLVKDAPPLT